MAGSDHETANDRTTSRVLGGYVLEERIGAGAMGVVWRAHRRSDGETVAVKVLREDLTRDAEMVKRFEREEEALKRVRGAHVAAMFGVIVDDNTVALVTEHVPGGDLRDWLKQRRARTPSHGASMVAQVLDGLASVHAAKVVHRDVKPENILLRASSDDVGDLVLSDFGLAHLPDLSTITHGVMGTPYYMAPELWAGDRATFPADLYAAGVVLYELVAGAPPFQGDSPMAVMRGHLDEPVPQLADCPEILWRLLTWLLAKDPDDRPESAAEARDALLTMAPKLPHAEPRKVPFSQMAGAARALTSRLRQQLHDALGSNAEGATAVMGDGGPSAMNGETTAVMGDGEPNGPGEPAEPPKSKKSKKSKKGPGRSASEAEPRRKPPVQEPPKPEPKPKPTTGADNEKLWPSALALVLVLAGLFLYNQPEVRQGVEEWWERQSADDGADVATGSTDGLAAGSDTTTWTPPTTTWTPPPEPAEAEVNDCIQLSADASFIKTDSCAGGAAPYMVTQVIEPGESCDNPDNDQITSGDYGLCLETNLHERYCYRLSGSGGNEATTPAGNCREPGTVTVIDIVPHGTDDRDCTDVYEWNRWLELSSPPMIICFMEY